MVGHVARGGLAMRYTGVGMRYRNGRNGRPLHAFRGQNGLGGAFFENGVFGQKWPKWPRAGFVPRPRPNDVLRPPFSSARTHQASSMVGRSGRRPASMQQRSGVGSNPGRARTLFLPPFFSFFLAPTVAGQRIWLFRACLRLRLPAAAGGRFSALRATFFGAILAPEVFYD